MGSRLLGKIVLTSYRDIRNHPGAVAISIARWMPHELRLLDMGPGVFAPEPASRFQHLIPGIFRTRYMSLLAERESSDKFRLAISCLVGILQKQDVLLCCWCYPQRQMRQMWRMGAANYQGLYCHRILLGYWLEKHLPLWSVSDIEMVYADGAENPIWPREGVAGSQGDREPRHS